MVLGVADVVKVIVAGSRYFTSYERLVRVIEWSRFKITELVSGGAVGVDTCAERWANENGVTIRRFPADWKQYGNAAGPIRNIAMAKYADGLLAYWDGRSVGTKNMIEKAAFRGLAIRLYVPARSKSNSESPQTKLRLMG